LHYYICALAFAATNCFSHWQCFRWRYPPSFWRWHSSYCSLPPVLIVHCGRSLSLTPWWPCLAPAVLIISARLSGFDPDLEEAAMDLGAPYGRVIVTILLPLIAPSILSAWLVTFTVSFDEVALAQILKGSDKTFPIYLLEQARPRHRDRLPMNIVFVVAMMVVTLLLFLTAEWIRRRGQPGTVR